MLWFVLYEISRGSDANCITLQTLAVEIFSYVPLKYAMVEVLFSFVLYYVGPYVVFFMVQLGIASPIFLTRHFSLYSPSDHVQSTWTQACGIGGRQSVVRECWRSMLRRHAILQRLFTRLDCRFAFGIGRFRLLLC